MFAKIFNFTIAGVLVFTFNTLTTSSTASTSQTIYQYAVSNPEFSHLNELIDQTNLRPILETASGEYTLFAPTNQALENLPEGVLDNLLLEENADTLLSIMSYHVIPGKVDTATLSTKNSVTTLENSNLKVSLAGTNSPFLNSNTSILEADIETSNGYIHIINEILIPPSINLAEFADTESLNITTVRTGGKD